MSIFNVLCATFFVKGGFAKVAAMFNTLWVFRIVVCVYFIKANAAYSIVIKRRKRSLLSSIVDSIGSVLSTVFQNLTANLMALFTSRHNNLRAMTTRRGLNILKKLPEIIATLS
jgi:hypothetical protein